jgi:hypothetical protein
VNVSIVLRYVLSVRNTNFCCRLSLGDGLWAMGVMLDNGVLPPLPCPVRLAKARTRKWRKGSDVRRT